MMPTFISATPRPDHVCRCFEHHDPARVMDLDIEAYHAGPGVSSTMVKDIVDKDLTPAHWHMKYVLGYLEKPQRDHYTYGRAYHSIIEDPAQALFKKSFAVMPAMVKAEKTTGRTPNKTGLHRAGRHRSTILVDKKCDGTTTEGKAFIAEAEAEGKEVLRERDYLKIVDSVNVLYEQAWARDLLEHPKCLFEASVYAQHETGITVRVRPDLWIPGEVVVDWKSARSAGPFGFARDAGEHKYHVQAAMYKSVLKETQFLFAAQEKNFPYLTAPYQVDTLAEARGHEAYQAGITLVAQCYESGEWPGYEGRVIKMPPWSLQ